MSRLCTLLALVILGTASLLSAAAHAAIAFRAATSANAIAAVSYIGSGAASTGANSITIGMPTTLVAGDLLICLIESHDTGTHITTTSGWTQLYSRTSPDPSAAHRASLFYKFAGASEAALAITHTGNSIVGRCAAFRGVDASNPFDAIYNSSAGAESDPDLTIETGTVTTVSTNAMLLLATHIANNPGSQSVTTTGGQTWVQAFLASTNTGNDSEVGLFVALKRTPAVVGPLVATANNQAGFSTGVVLALRPASQSSLTIAKPTGTSANDVLIASIAVSSSTATITPPASCGTSGWQQVSNSPIVQNSGNPSRLATFYCVAGASEPTSYTWTTSGGHSGLIGGLVSFTGVDTSSPIHTAAGAATASSNTHATPTITTTVSDVMLVTTHEFTSSGTWTPPSGMTEMVDLASLTTNNDAGISMEMNYQLQTTAATVSKSATASNPPAADTGAAQILALTPSICPVTAGFATCICDDFGRASLNPSSIFGGDWTVTNSGGTFGNPLIVSNYLRMTDNSANAATAATVPGSFPAAGNNISVEFLHYAYNGTNPGADGIGLTLSDAALTPTAGAFGGSLGYAQKCQNGVNGCISDCTTPGGCPGFNGGWLGIGIDEWGNFGQGIEGRSGGVTCSPAPSCSSQAVTLRGSSPSYPYLATSGALSPTIDDSANTSRSRGHRYRITVDARNYTWNGSTGNKSTLVRVERDTTGTGTSYVTLPNLNLTNIYDYNTGQANVPTNWKLSFTGSTGISRNIHEIKGLKICSTFYTPPGSFDIESNSSSSLTCATPGGNPSVPIITIRARDYQGALNTGYTGTITLSAKVGSTLSSTVTWRRVNSGANIANGGTYTFVAGDGGVAQFYLSDTASESLTLTVSDTSSVSTSTNPITFSNTATSYIIEDAENTIGAVAGRPHLFKVTHITGCGPTAVSGTLAMSGWYSPDSSDPGGAAPRMCPALSSTSCLPDVSPQTCSNAQLTTSAPGSSNLTLDFNGNAFAYFCLKSSDVGKYSLMMRETALPSSTTASTPLMTIRPFAVVVNDVKQVTVSGLNTVTINNPASSANGGAAFVSAGSNFQATVGGYRWSASADADNNGVPDAAVNFGAITTGGIAPKYSDTVTLSAALAEPAGGTGGTLSGNSVAVTGGSTTQLSLSYSEVGTFNLGATPSLNYLNTANLSLSNRVAIYSNPNSSAQHRVVGRFKPDHFGVVANSLTHGCGSFTYEGQAFSLGFTVQAQNKSGNPTQNYGVSGYAPVASGALMSLVAENGDDGTDRNNPARILPALPTISSTIPSASAWGDGSALAPYGQFAVAGSYTFTRAANAEGPFSSLNVGLKVVDSTSDNVPLAGANMTATTSGACAPNCDAVLLGATDMRYGRMRIDNAYGSELLDLPVTLEAQYWNGTQYVRNTADNCTPLTSGNYTFTGQTGNPTGKVGINTTNMNKASNFIDGTTMSGGIGKIRLRKPTAPPTVTAKGSVLLNSTIPYLPGTGRETFGVYKSGPVIYFREQY
jgi:MSHA biogenesis protein MshQ